MKNKNPLLIDTGRGFSVLYGSRYLYSTTDPEGSAENKAKNTILQGETLYILPSVLLFYGIGEIVSQLPKDSHIICFELSRELLSLTLEHIPNFISESKFVTVVDDTSSVSVLQKAEQLGVWRFRRAKLLNLTGGYALNASEYKVLIDSLNSKIEGYWKNRMTLIHMAPLWIKNIFLNLSRLYQSSTPPTICKYQKINSPILVAGAGESLEYSIDFIRTHRNKFRLMAVDTALSVLIENNITPDFIVAVDAQIFNLFDFMKAKNLEIPLFFDITGYPGILSATNGNIFPFISNFAENKLLKRLSEYQLLPKLLPPLGSVGLTSVYLAMDISSSSILYTGLDFSYKIGKSHAKGAPVHIQELIRNSRIHPPGQLDLYFQRSLITQRDKEDKPVITDLILSSYAELMRNRFGNSERLFDIGELGLPSGGKPIDVKSNFPLTGNDISSSLYTEIDDTKVMSESFTAFCRNELELLNKIYNSTFSYLSGKTKEGEALVQLITEADYLYLHFPDKYPYPKTDEGFLKRLLVTCGHYIGILER